MKDLFEHYTELPIEVQQVLDNYSEIETYEDCERLIKELNSIGYTCDYSLDAVPFGLQKMN